MSAGRRVVITGLGVVCPVGHGKESVWEALVAGRSGVTRITRFDASRMTSQVAGEVKDFDPTHWMDRRVSKRLDRFSQVGMAAAVDAVADSGLDFDHEDPARAGVIVGTGIGGINEIQEQHKRLLEYGPERVSPFLIPKLMANACAGQISIRYGLRGPNSCSVTACASAAHSIADAFKLVQSDEADVMITGGAEAAITALGVAGFCSLKALSRRNDDPSRASRPFDAERDGFVMSEGAGIVVLEELERARKRGAPIYAEFLGVGLSGDGSHITAPDPEAKGAVRSMQMAMRDAECRPEDVGYINAHGTSTQLNDKVETLAIKKAFGDHAGKLAISSTKSMIGHLLGASGGVDLVACALSIHHGVLHPTINQETPDPDCDLDYVPNEAREARPGKAISNSFGFGGHNASLLIGEFS